MDRSTMSHWNSSRNSSKAPQWTPLKITLFFITLKCYGEFSWNWSFHVRMSIMLEIPSNANLIEGKSFKKLQAIQKAVSRYDWRIMLEYWRFVPKFCSWMAFYLMFHKHTVQSLLVLLKDISIWDTCFFMDCALYGSNGDTWIYVQSWSDSS